MSFSTIAVKLVRLVMSKINKQQNKKSDKFTNSIFLKIVSNIRDAFGANHFTS